MLREIIRPQEEIYKLHIPKEYLNTEVEILVLPFSYPGKNMDIDVLLDETAGIIDAKVPDPVNWQKTLRDEYER